MDRYTPEIEHPLSLAVSDHPVSEMMHSGQPYVCADVETQRRFGHDETLLKAWIPQLHQSSADQARGRDRRD